MTSVDFFTHRLDRRESDPPWKSRVERWYQLDDFASAILDAYTRWKERLPEKPSFIFLASPAASNATDRAFIVAGASRPALFAHTLPNIRISPLCQLMDWSGPVLCVQKDPYTQVSALSEAACVLSAEFPRVWVLGVDRIGEKHRVNLFVLNRSGQSPLKIQARECTDSAIDPDESLWRWLESPKQTGFPLSSVHQLTRNAP